MILFKIGFWILVAALTFHLLTKKFLNPFKFTMVVGKKGSGKTTWMVELIYKYLRRGWTVYANLDVPGVNYFDPKDIGKYTFPSGSVVLIDEANLFWDNRKWKDVAAALIEWFRYQRQSACGRGKDCRPSRGRRTALISQSRPPVRGERGSK